MNQPNMQNNIIQFPKREKIQAKAKMSEPKHNMTRAWNGMGYSCHKSYYIGYQYYVGKPNNDQE